MQIWLHGLIKQILSVAEMIYVQGQVKLEKMGIELFINGKNSIYGVRNEKVYFNFFINPIDGMCSSIIFFWYLVIY